jgi:hypothetical protein
MGQARKNYNSCSNSSAETAGSMLSAAAGTQEEYISQYWRRAAFKGVADTSLLLGIIRCLGLLIGCLGLQEQQQHTG